MAVSSFFSAGTVQVDAVSCVGVAALWTVVVLAATRGHVSLFVSGSFLSRRRPAASIVLVFVKLVCWSLYVLLRAVVWLPLLPMRSCLRFAGVCGVGDMSESSVTGLWPVPMTAAFLDVVLPLEGVVDVMPLFGSSPSESLIRQTDGRRRRCRRRYFLGSGVLQIFALFYGRQCPAYHHSVFSCRVQWHLYGYAGVWGFFLFFLCFLILTWFVSLGLLPIVVISLSA